MTLTGPDGEFRQKSKTTSLVLLTLSPKTLPLLQDIKSSKSYPMGIYWPAKKRKQSSVIRECDEMLTLVGTATSVGKQDKQKRG